MEVLTLYSNFEKLLKERGETAYKVAKETGISQPTLSDWKNGKSVPKADKLQKIADHFNVTLDYLMTGKEPNQTEPELTTKDKRDIAKDLDRIMSEIKNGQDGPLYYNGEEIDEASINLLQNAIEFALTQTKKINKVKYNPNKNKK